MEPLMLIVLVLAVAVVGLDATLMALGFVYPRLVFRNPTAQRPPGVFPSFRNPPGVFQPP